MKLPANEISRLFHVPLLALDDMGKPELNVCRFWHKMKSFLIIKALLISIFFAGVYSAHSVTLLTNGLVAYFPLNAGAVDDSGNGHNGITRATTSAPDIFERPNDALAFDGQNSEIQIPLNYEFSQIGFTFSAMFYFDRAYSETAHQHYLMDGRDGNSGIVYANVDSGLIQALGTDVHPSLPLSARQWYHLIVSHDNTSGQTQIFLNGILIHSARVDSKVNLVRSITLGRRFSGTEYLSGRLADIRIYNRALSAQEASELYAYETQPHDSNQIVEEGDPFVSDEHLINPATGLPVERPDLPTNNILELSNVTGDLHLLDSKGLVLETNFNYLPRIEISSLSSNELAALLENQTAYYSLTTFGRAKYTNEESIVLESQLENTWLRGKSLQEKIQTRLQIIDAMLVYNSDVSSYSQCVSGASDAHAAAISTELTTDSKNETAIDAATEVERAREFQYYGIKGAGYARYQAEENNENATRDLIEAGRNQIQAENAAISANQKESYYLNKCQADALNLAKFGINVSTSPPFYLIPSLSIKNGVDFERAELRE